jgi:hypothetical protein
MSFDQTETADFILLGGQISSKHPIFKDIAQLSSYAGAWVLLNKLKNPDFKKLTATDKISDIIYSLGQIEFINTSGELTKLSAILGDTRQRHSQKGLKDELTQRIYGSTQP